MALNMSVRRILICPLDNEYVRWTPDLSVGLLLCSFFFLGTLKKSSSFFITTLPRNFLCRILYERIISIITGLLECTVQCVVGTT